MIRRPPRSTQSRSSAASDVYKRQRLLPRSSHVLSWPDTNPRGTWSEFQRWCSKKRPHFVCDSASSADSPFVLEEADSDSASSADSSVLADAGSIHAEPSTTFSLSYRGSRSNCRNLLCHLCILGKRSCTDMFLLLLFLLVDVSFRPLSSPPVGCPESP